MGERQKKYFKDKGGLNLLPFTFHLSLTFPPSPSKTSHPPQPGSPQCAELAVHHLTIISTRSFRAKSRKYQGKADIKEGRKSGTLLSPEQQKTQKKESALASMLDLWNYQL